MAKLTKEKFLNELHEHAEYLTNENYHTEAGFLYDLADKVENASEDDWKDIVVERVLHLGP